jgi:OmcA/MtrC family decaheme c-type cytochrome
MKRSVGIADRNWAILLASVFLLALGGCSGDDGAPGAAGAAGAPGLACWDLNGNGVADDPDEDTNGDGLIDALDCQPVLAALTNPVETCAVCHGENAIADAGPMASHDLPPIESVSNVAFAVNGADLDVTFDVAADGAPAASYDLLQRGYRNDGTTLTEICIDADDDNVCDPTSMTLTNNGGGNYTIKVLGGAAAAAINHRYLFRVQDSAERETRTYFYADFPASPFAADVSPVAVDAGACANCHGPEGIPVHGSAFIASDGGEVCLTCHGAERPPSDPIPPLFQVVHGYHQGIGTWEDPIETIEITYPTYMNNCSVCHQTVDQLANVNAMPITPAGCLSCHGTVADIPFGAAAAPLHAGADETTDCQLCHMPGGLANAVLTVADVHNGAITGNDGVIWDGVDTSVTEGAKIAWQITGVADDGTDLSITWQASYDGVGVDPCNATGGVGAPVFFADGEGNLSILRNYAQGEDFILGTRDRPGQPGTEPEPDLYDVSVDNTTCAGNVATTVVPVEVTDATYGRVGIQGKPRLPNIDPDPDDPGFVDDYGSLMPVRAKSPTFDWVVGEGGAADQVRRAVVDTTNKCLDCHVGSLYQHGGNRVDNIDLCMLCHNTAANDQYVREDYGVDASEAYDGRVGQAFGMREMLHAVHSAGETGAPIVIYRGRGIYAWARSVDKLSNWPAGDWPGDIPGLPIFGSDDGTGNPRTQTHHFHTPTFPRGIYDCAACHVEDDPDTGADEGFAVMPDPTVAMASTVEAGATGDGDPLDDVLEGITASSCMTCHRSDDPALENTLKAHAYQNSWTPQAFEEGRQTIIEANQ